MPNAPVLPNRYNGLFTRNPDGDGNGNLAKKVPMVHGDLVPGLMYHYLKPIQGYWPFVVEVVGKIHKDDPLIAYHIIHTSTLARINSIPIVSDLSDPTQVYPLLPSTVKDVDLVANPLAKYAFLMIEESYYKRLRDEDHMFDPLGFDTGRWTPATQPNNDPKYHTDVKWPQGSAAPVQVQVDATGSNAVIELAIKVLIDNKASLTDEQRARLQESLL